MNSDNNKRNKIIVIMLFLVSLLALLGIFVPYPNKKTETIQPTNKPEIIKNTPINSETEINQESSRIKISGVEINNFYKQAISVKKDGFAKFIRTKKYEIMFIPADNSFLISITGYPFYEAKKEAEEDFVKELGITKEDACKLNVNITTPAFVNPDYAGKNYKLSFCEN